MNIVGLFTIKNCCDVVELLMRHHARMYDQLVVVDDTDADGTFAILTYLKAEGLPITLWDSGASPYEYRQNVSTVRSLRRIAEEFDPDYVMIHDEDEFIQAKSRAELVEGLSSIPDGTCGYHLLETYVPIDITYDEHSNPLHALFRRRVPERSEMPKCIIPRDILRTCELSVGSHVVFEPSRGHLHGKKMPWTLAHVPVRSPAQTMSRTIIAGSKVWGSEQKQPDGGYEPDYWIREHGYRIDKERLLYYAMNRAVFADEKPTSVDPDSRMISDDLSIRYRHEAKVNIVGVLDHGIEDLARECHRLREALAAKGGE